MAVTIYNRNVYIYVYIVYTLYSYHITEWNLLEKLKLSGDEIFYPQVVKLVIYHIIYIIFNSVNAELNM